MTQHVEKNVLQKFVHSQKLMGTAFELGLYAKDEAFAMKMLDLGVEKIKSLESVLTEFRPESDVSLLNREANDAFVSVGEECFSLLKRSNDISRLTKGAFDVSIGALKKIYSFKKQDFQLPSKAVVKKAMRSVGYNKILFDKRRRSVKFNNSKLSISFAGIGKGFAADEVKKIWKQEGVAAGFINASGDLCVFGVKPGNLPWNVSIPHPDDKSKILFDLPLEERAIATSGDYEQFFLYKGERYSHTINPLTGLPLRGIKSVSIVSPSAELSDALATACYVMGKEKCLRFVNELPQTHCILIDDANKLYLSKDIRYLMRNEI